MCEEKVLQIIELIDSVQDAIEAIQLRTQQIGSGNDFLLTPDNSFLLDGVCMKLIFIGESIKTIDKISHGELLSNYKDITWKDVMRLRDLIAHHYFRIDADLIFTTIKHDLVPLQTTLMRIKDDLPGMI